MRKNRTERTPLKPWSRERLLAVLATGVVAALVLLIGLGMALWQAFAITRPPATPAHTEDGSGMVNVQRDQIAEEPMLSVAREDATKGVPAVTELEPITIPEPRVLRGPARVPAGFPHTPEGAVGQLAMIQATVLESMDLDTVRSVHAAWVTDGGPTVEEWVLTRSVQSFLANIGTGPDGPKATVKANPAGAMVKGSDGPDWVLACVLLDVHAVLRTEARVGFGHCERMAWDGSRWRIDAGAAPAFAPSTWPGSQKAAEAGWRPWVYGGAES